MSVDAPALLERGISFAHGGRHTEALAVYDDMLRQWPEHLDALNNRAIALVNLGRTHEALRSFSRALELKLDFAEALRNRGMLLSQLGEFGGALEDFDRALRLQPAFAEAKFGRSIALIELDRCEEALTGLEEVLADNPLNAGALYAKAEGLARLEQHGEAKAAFDRAAHLSSPTPRSLNEHGCVLLAMRDLPQGLHCFDRALEMQPNFWPALANRGLALRALGRYEEALASIDHALTVKPDDVACLDNRGVVLCDLGRYKEALAAAEAALRINPEYAPGHLQVALICLRQGDYQRGLPEYEWRARDKAQGLGYRNLRAPRWTGDIDPNGKSILVHAEQGLGDTIQFLRYLPMLADKGANVLVEVPAILVSLARTLDSKPRIFAAGEDLPATGYHCPLLSLPFEMGTTADSIPARVPYLSVEIKMAGKWRRSLASDNRKLVAICWRGNANYVGNAERSIPFRQFVSLLDSPGVRFISLQKELYEEEQGAAAGLAMVHVGEGFEDTAEIVAAADLVISVDTVWAHLAGALGKPVWVLLQHTPRWVWHVGREDSPWYPTARLFRQTQAGLWKNVLDRVKTELIRWRQREPKSAG